MAQIDDGQTDALSRLDALAATTRVGDDRLEAVRRAAQRWQNELLDTTGRNRLRRYRDLKTGTLDLTPGADAGASAQALDRLLAGRKVRLSDLYSTVASAAMAAPLDDARRRVSAIHKTALTNLEEKGIDTCFAAIGLASWRVEQGTEPNAPVILVPLHTVPTGAATRDFDVSVAGDAHLNPVLARIVRSEHGIEIDDIEADVAEDPPTSLEAFDEFLDQLTGAWSELPEFAITSRVVAGNFSYSTMPLVQDLDQGAEAFAQNDLVAAIAGVEPARAALTSRTCDPSPSQPDRDPPESEFLILDADSSQNLAINRVLGGESVVIQGPPGTGKSQTISNLIGTLVAHGKRVLFVAEKRAAIEAVTKRLDLVGLDNLVMDLHGGVTSRREFARHLSDSLDHVATIPAQDHTELHGRLKNRRDELLADKAAVHDQREPWKLSVFEMRQRLLGVPVEARTSSRLSSDSACSIDRESFEQLSRNITEWIDLGGHDLPTSHPEWSRSTIETAQEAQAAFELVRGLAVDQLPAARSAIAACLDEIGAALPDTYARWRDALDSLADIRQMLERFSDDLYALDNSGLRSSLASARKSAMARAGARLFSGAYRQACKSVVATLSESGDLSPADALDTLDRAGKQLSAWSELSAEGLPRVPQGLDDATDRVTAAAESLAALQKHGVLTESDTTAEPVAALAATLNRLASSSDVAQKLPRIRELESGFRTAEVMSLLEQAGHSYPAPMAAHVVEHAWLFRVLEDLSFTDARLSGFDSDRATRVRDEYAQFDRQHLDVAPMRLRRRLAQSVISAMDAHPEEATLIRTEAGKKRRHLSIRQLLARAPHVLTALRPCWTMSPVLTAEMIPSDANIFDVVVFDEASQIPPAEAIGSLARAPQAVIAGDSRQLPPTAFFGRESANDDEADDEAPIATDDIESLLEVADIFLRDTMLTWHYRSRDDRLIAFSNEHIYGGSLTAFPGSSTDCPLTHHLVPFRPLAEVNGTRSNPDEALLVAERVLDHARTLPDETLGVIAFGQAHADAIENALMRELRDLNEPALDEFFSEANDERFFVKNIERVQGDERDAIILSVGYHKDANGRLPYRFGPLNQEGGERRLNVAVTRARSRVDVVSSFGHHDMDPGRSSAKGVELLRQYLQYAATEARVLGTSAHDVPLNPFELSVKEGLERRGIPITPQYGVSGYRIDFACAHPDKPGQMVLAIEADGATYHSTPTARDADRLRQQVLEGKGWRVHRIWSTAWFNNREAELDKAEAAWREAVRAADGFTDPATSASSVTGRQSRTGVGVTGLSPTADGPEMQSVQRAPRPAVPRRGSLGYDGITDYRHDQLVALARWIESDTLLRTESDMIAAMMDELGFRRGGSRIVAALEMAIRETRPRRRVVRRSRTDHRRS
ncbi:AAA domain-containing protein [Candidatus Poriferisodalis sp.]|uniref:AAA domain-containing protein n=1 Tax=Candidatus Poriferisodalis sp. TaxID=3101277 RepID=UPI003C6F706D